jgi:hypothetical protein
MAKLYMKIMGKIGRLLTLVLVGVLLYNGKTMYNNYIGEKAILTVVSTHIFQSKEEANAFKTTHPNYSCGFQSHVIDHDQYICMIKQ